MTIRASLAWSEIPPSEEAVHGQPGGAPRLISAQVPPPEGGARGGEAAGGGRLQAHTAAEDRAGGRGPAVADGLSWRLPPVCTPRKPTRYTVTETLHHVTGNKLSEMDDLCPKGLR